MLLPQNVNFELVLPPVADAFDTAKSSATVDMSRYGRCTFVVIEAAGGTGTATLQVMACTGPAAAGSAGAGATAVAHRYATKAAAGAFAAIAAAAAAGQAPAAGANKLTVLEVTASDLPEGSRYVQVKATEVVNSPVLAGILAILSEPRFAHDAQPSVIGS